MTAMIPTAEYRCSDCSLCGRDTVPGDGEVLCQHCRVGWSSKRYWSPGYRCDPETSQCAEVTNPWDGDDQIGHVRYRCLLNVDHTGAHIGGCDLRDDLSVHEWARS